MSTSTLSSMSSSQLLMGPGGGLLNGTGSSQLSAKTKLIRQSEKTFHGTVKTCCVIQCPLGVSAGLTAVLMIWT